MEIKKVKEWAEKEYNNICRPVKDLIDKLAEQEISCPDVADDNKAEDDENNKTEKQYVWSNVLLNKKEIRKLIEEIDRSGIECSNILLGVENMDGRIQFYLNKISGKALKLKQLFFGEDK